MPTSTMLKILLVEDDPADVRLLSEQLKDASVHCQVTPVSRVAEALELLAAARYDAIVLDLSLPDSHGLETVARILAEAPRVPILVLSGLDDQDVAVAAVQAGAQDYLVKGRFDGPLLGRALRYAVERAQLAGQVERQRRQLQDLVASMPGVVWEAWGEPDAATQRIDFVSGHVERMLGYTVDEWLATPNFWLSIVHPADRERAAREAFAIFSAGSGGTNQFRWVARDGRVVWVEAHSVVLCDERGRPAGMRGVTLDISGRKQAEEALRASERRLQILADSSQAFAEAGLDLDALNEPITRRVTELLGDTCSLRLLSDDGRWLETVSVHHRDPEALALLRQPELMQPQPATEGVAGLVVRTGGAVLVPELAQDRVVALCAAPLRRYLERFPVHSLVAVPLTAHGRLLGVLGASRHGAGRPYTASDQLLLQDLAHRAALAISSARQYRQISREARRKDEFLAMLGHELRNPLAPIVSAVEVLQHKPADERLRTWGLGVVQRQVRHMVRLVDDLLDVSRITRGTIELRRETLELGEALERAAGSVEPILRSRQLQLQFQYPAEPLLLEADPVRLEQVLVNLLHNAAKFTPAGGSVWLEAWREAGELVVRVRDSGIGMSPQTVASVFDLFYQAHTSLDRAHGGLGIGLTLVRRLVELHGGSVSAASAGPGLGSEFTVRLPALAAPAAGA